MAAHFTAYWVDVAVKSSLTWGIGFLQCFPAKARLLFPTKARLVFGEGIFFCADLVTLASSPPPPPLPPTHTHMLKTGNLLGHCKNSKGGLVPARWDPLCSAQPQSDDEVGKQLSYLYPSASHPYLLLNFWSSVKRRCLFCALDILTLNALAMILE